MTKPLSYVPTRKNKVRKLYILNIIDDTYSSKTGYYNSIIVRTTTPRGARKLANEFCSEGHPEGFWLDHTLSSVEKLTDAGMPGILMTEFIEIENE